MALNVSSTLIYAGRYHYGKTVTANLLDKKIIYVQTGVQKSMHCCTRIDNILMVNGFTSILYHDIRRYQHGSKYKYNDF